MPLAMIVEDQDATATMMEDTLRLVGYDILHVRDGQAALDQIAAGVDATLITLDINMPKVAGHDVYTTIRANTAYDDVPIIITTANVYMANIVQEDLHDGDSLFIKPIDLREIQRIAKEIKTQA